MAPWHPNSWGGRTRGSSERRPLNGLEKCISFSGSGKGNLCPLKGGAECTAALQVQGEEMLWKLPHRHLCPKTPVWGCCTPVLRTCSAVASPELPQRPAKSHQSWPTGPVTPVLGFPTAPTMPLKHLSCCTPLATLPQLCQGPLILAPHGCPTQHPGTPQPCQLL